MPISRSLFLLAVIFWLGLAGYGIFQNPDPSTQEVEDIVPVLEITQQPLLKTIFGIRDHDGRQRGWQILIYAVAKLLNQTSLEQFLITARILSIILGLSSIFILRFIFYQNFPRSNPDYLSILTMFHPLFFFYSMQAEEYSLLLFFIVLQLWAYLSFGKNRFAPIIFLIASVLGYYTQLLFLLLLGAECLAEIIKYFQSKRIVLWPFLITGLLVINVPFQATNMTLQFCRYPLNTPLNTYDCLNPVDLFSYLNMLGTFWGITPSLFVSPILAILVILLWGYSFYALWLNRKEISNVFWIYYCLLLFVFFVWNLRLALASILYSAPMRFCIPLAFLNILILFGRRFTKPKAYLAACLLFIFILTNILIVGRPYNMIGRDWLRSQQSNLKSLPAIDQGLFIFFSLQATHALLFNSPDYPFLISPDSTPSHYYIPVRPYERTSIYKIRQNYVDFSLPDFSDKTVMELSSRLGLPISNVNSFLSLPGTTKLLLKLLHQNNLKLDTYERLFLADKHISVLAKNGLLLALLYPDLCSSGIQFFRRTSLYHLLDAFFKRTSTVHFLYVNEFILGINHFDTIRQDKSLMLLQKNPSLILKQTHNLTNLTVYSFEKREHPLKNQH